ncbi:MAG: glycoside hydrolase [Planctomycetes bacterium]|nr:glycoside hydrolase [Planctomycetota bacterium]MCH9726732.1 glycoside hydrolase [Planctomycetota bacterium]MCH9779640.1 glycoside hydrolase [Planctomycetota bacterium]MCH9792192.1 glycoside hydrolase [Planctomycetota bacterium]
MMPRFFLRRSVLFLIPFVWMTFTSLVPAAEFDVVVSPRVTVVEREGITGGGHPVRVGDSTLLFYPHHPDDFGRTVGTGSSYSANGGFLWKQGKDHWPLPKMIDLWADQLRNGDLLAMGLHWTPDPKKRREITPEDLPSDAYRIAISKDRGKSWSFANATIDCPPELGVIARPLPHIIEDKNGALLMPAYAWSSRGNRVVLLRSEDRGHHWNVYSTITTAIAMIKSGAAVTTPWLESTVSLTKDGDLLAIVRTGSTAKSPLVSVRSTDHGKTWSLPEKLPFAGKLPTLHLLPNGLLTLVTALSRNHCRLYLSADGTGRSWSNAHIISSLTGGNVGVAIAGTNKLIITTPTSRRINAWNVQIKPRAEMASGLAAPTNITMNKGILTWTPSANAVAYRVTPVLIKPGPSYMNTDILTYAATQTRDETPKLELGRQLLPGSTYAFKISAVDGKGRVSPAVLSDKFQP